MVCFCSLDQIPHEQLVHVQTHALHAVGWTPDNIPQEFAHAFARAPAAYHYIHVPRSFYARTRSATCMCVFAMLGVATNNHSIDFHLVTLLLTKSVIPLYPTHVNCNTIDNNTAALVDTCAG